VNMKDKNWPLLLAVQKNRIGIVLMLLECDTIKFDLKDEQGRMLSDLVRSFNDFGGMYQGHPVDG
jgi:hypothetical protein